MQQPARSLLSSIIRGCRGCHAPHPRQPSNCVGDTYIRPPTFSPRPECLRCLTPAATAEPNCPLAVTVTARLAVSNDGRPTRTADAKMPARFSPGYGPNSATRGTEAEPLNFAGGRTPHTNEPRANGPGNAPTRNCSTPRSSPGCASSASPSWSRRPACPSTTARSSGSESGYRTRGTGTRCARPGPPQAWRGAR
jgi:hypothetical protein